MASGKKRIKNKNYVVYTDTIEAGGRNFVARGLIRYREFNVFAALPQISCQAVHLLRCLLPALCAYGSICASHPSSTALICPSMDELT
jgi:hypothetical protein